LLVAPFNIVSKTIGSKENAFFHRGEEVVQEDVEEHKRDVQSISDSILQKTKQNKTKQKLQ
jgi:hypothetical protein